MLNETSSSIHKQEISIVFTVEDLNLLGVVFDTAIKASGVQGAKIVLPLFEKIEAAVNEFNNSQVEHRN